MRAAWLHTQLIRALVTCILFCPLRALGSPTVSVSLRASFDAPPFLLELLETAAEENATAYFPLLDQIADGRFAKANTDKDLYESFLQVLEDDGHLSAPESLASFQFALSVHSAAPRIEAHYQFYNSSIEPLLGPTTGDCGTWVHFDGKRYCSPALDKPQETLVDQKSMLERQLDHVLSLETNAPPSIFYTDVTGPAFAHFHKILSKSAKEGKTSYRVRYIRSGSILSKPLIVNGYGVELALKRTDYIVIDDRDANPATKSQDLSSTESATRKQQSDLRPLSTSELSELGLKTASMILSSSGPMEALLQISQDFPKHSAEIASQNTSFDLLEEIKDRADVLPGGYSGFWMNGIPLDARQVEAYAILHHMRREMRLIGGLKGFGLSGSEAIKLISHSAISNSKANNELQRYDYRDNIEGGGVIIWLNDLEKDQRYNRWPSAINALLQRSYPGQLPSVRRDVHNLVMPVDLANSEDVALVVEQLLSFVQRSIPIRFGFVPLLESSGAVEQARVTYYLLQEYGLGAMIAYLEACLKGKHCEKPKQSLFNSVVQGRKPKKDGSGMSLTEVLKSDTLNDKLHNARSYSKRLDVHGKVLPVFVNGVAVPRNDEWLSTVINQVNLDLRRIQQAILEEQLQDSAWLPSHFLSQAAKKRNVLVIPEDETEVKIIDMNKATATHRKEYELLPGWEADQASARDDWAELLIVVDSESEDGKNLLDEALRVRLEDSSLKIVVLHNPPGRSGVSHLLENLRERNSKWPALSEHFTKGIHSLSSADFWQLRRTLLNEFGLSEGQRGLILNGRLVGPIPAASELDRDDFVQLLEYERSRRSRPVYAALEDMNLSHKINDPTTAARLISIITISTKSDVPEGIFEATSTVRVNAFEQWKTEHSAIITGNMDTALVQIVAALDPASETAQRWVPILKVLSELDGVSVKIFLNPRENLQELPIKRFYRYVLQSKPSFVESGSVARLDARFTEVPTDSLLTVGMDVPPSWLVAPKESIHDLDNIKLSALKEDEDLHALYELEHILIEGHSRDLSTGSPPRGAQLVLGTEKEPHAADTIIMANLGYFQFKANPGFWKMSLKPGRTEEIFTMESAGTKGYAPQPGDEGADVDLLGFRGKTLFPRLARKPGRETDDVLEDAVPAGGKSVGGLFSKGLARVQHALNAVGLAEQSKQADINIFSVASGHLYERMLNIMMVSVMKHTKHSVKFWFIKQFLSPSFKDTIPLLASEYGFTYELVTYKWPHWLRAQREKQREIWGYKILFLDVLFPLSLDKIIFVDADQVVRTDMYELVRHDLHGAAYGFTPMCDSRAEMEGFRFWKQGYWKNYLRGLPYHISALYVVDLGRFRTIAAGDRLRQQYHQLAADPNSLSNLDQDLPNHMQHTLPIHSLPQDWLWCETWCADEDLARARTIDLCNNPMTKEPKLERARRQLPEWTVYDEEIAAVVRRRREVRQQQEEKAGWVGSESGESTASEEGSSKSVSSRDEL